MRRRNVVRGVIVLAVGAVAVTTCSALWRRAHDPLRSLAPYVFHERHAVGYDYRLSVTHLKGIDVSRAFELLEPNLTASGFSRESDFMLQYPYSVDATYANGKNEQIEVIDGHRQHLDGVLIVCFREPTVFESLSRRLHAARPDDPFYDSVGSDDVLRRFLKE